MTAHLPAPVARTAKAVRARLRGLRYTYAALPAFPSAATAPVRMLVGPTNSAGQGYEWARAARTLPGVAADAFAIHRTAAFRFADDYGVPQARWSQSRWARAQREHVLGSYTHVLVESLRPILGYDGHSDAAADIAVLQEAGVDVALLFHGSDIRLPSRHAARERFSPFAHQDEFTHKLEVQARRHAELIESLGLPVFVSTPDLLIDVPQATWLPVVIDPAPWATAARPLFSAERPIVVHAPSSSRLKGSARIDEVLTGLQERGLIEYRRITGIAHAEMPSVIGSADIVVDQLGIGLYGVAAAEALAAGRIVVSYVGSELRARVRSLTGREVPIVEADDDTLSDVVGDLVANPQAAADQAAAGPGFAAELHDGRRAAEVLSHWLTEKETL
ncbi:hypothetical protein HPO96_32500 [Kribbella sandramycini]|uniref:Glycosyltransferase involved in cell wall biosynthesis n=1 Tax=Kribbella sandramycini TaxID=60450 RepID=A0A7Y4L5W6_9ACTN|nr:hypothetical protein [Kribbella sandramycini]MBB6565978.1 hypothetical protein [Kribbella sandramycini]NOL44980.1 hypothetical protein [Kribbella sandramycini]